MKIGFISDLHFDYNEKHFNTDLASAFIQHINGLELDYLLISGDISSYYEQTIDLVETFNQNSDTAIYFVPGNHDVWMKSKDSFKSLRHLNEHKYCLTNKKLELNDDWAIVGSFPWYDYSLETLGSSKADYEEQKALWIDSRFTDWKETNYRFLQKQLDKTKNVIEKIPKDKNIILIEHFVPREEFIVHIDGNDKWNFGNAFMGSEKIGQFSESYENIKTVSFGHTHHRFGSTKINGVEYICNPLGYEHEWKTNDFITEVKACLTIKTI